MQELAAEPENDPGAHVKHAVEVMFGEYVPLGQSKHERSASFLPLHCGGDRYVPRGQVVLQVRHLMWATPWVPSHPPSRYSPGRHANSHEDDDDDDECELEDEDELDEELLLGRGGCIA